MDMEYGVKCECGRQQPVTASQAGLRLACSCGREVSVPSLRSLRVAAGQPVTETPELVIKAMLRDGRVPEGDECAECSIRTDDIFEIQAECEKKELRGSGQGGTLHTLLAIPAWLFLGPVFAIFYLSHVLRRPDEPREIGHDLSFDLPIRLCTRCAGRLRGRSLKRAMKRVPVYERLLQKYPRAQVSLKVR